MSEKICTSTFQIKCKIKRNYFQISNSIFIFFLVKKSLLLSGIYKKNVISTDLLLPWMAFYILMIFGFVSVAALLVIFMENNNEKENFKLFSILPSALAAYYCLLWVCVYKLYRKGLKPKANFLAKFSQIALEPLANRILQVETVEE